MRPFKTAIAALAFLSVSPAALAIAGEIIIDTPQGAGGPTNADRARDYSGTSTGSGNVVVVAPEAPTGPPTPGQTNDEAITLDRAHAKAYVNPVQDGGGEPTVIVTPGGGGDPQSNHDALLQNGAKAGAYVRPAGNGGQAPNVIILGPGGAEEADPLARNRARAQTLSRGRKPGTSGAQTLVIVPGASPTEEPSNRQRLDADMDKARAWSDGDAAARRNCTGATVSVGTVGNVAVVDRNGNATSVSQGVNTTSIGACP